MSWVLIGQRLLMDFVLHIFYFPLWWYSRGVQKIFRVCKDLFTHVSRQFAPLLWAKNLFVPMFGQRDWQGRIMSFFMRLANIIFRSFLVLVWSFILLCLVMVWLMFPLGVIYMALLSTLANFSV